MRSPERSAHLTSASGDQLGGAGPPGGRRREGKGVGAAVGVIGEGALGVRGQVSGEMPAVYSLTTTRFCSRGHKYTRMNRNKLIKRTLK